MYQVKEIFYSLQGEGARTGRPAIFLRFAGCNLWTGRESDRSSAICRFCDTDFLGIGPDGGRFAEPAALARAVASRWPSAERAARYVVCTGGEPALQLDAAAIDALHAEGFEVAIETNGTLPLPGGIDWICMSPKASTEIVVRRGDELKLVYPQPDAMPERFEGFDFAVRFLQPMDGPDLAANTQYAIAYCLANPTWRLSLQTHKLLGLR